MRLILSNSFEEVLKELVVCVRGLEVCPRLDGEQFDSFVRFNIMHGISGERDEGISVDTDKYATGRNAWTCTSINGA